MAAARVPVAVTFGIALATLLVAGGILAGPTIASCASDPDGLAACLRERIGELGLGGGPEPEVIAEIPIETGRLEVLAAAPPAILPSAASLAMPPGQVEAMALDVLHPAEGKAELAVERGDIAATGAPERPAPPATTVLAPSPVVLAVTVASPVLATPPAATLAPAAGALDAGASAPEAAPAVAELQPLPPPEPEPSAEPPPQAFETPLIEAEAPALPVQAPAPKRPAPVIRNDPSFPNVTVLPPPAKGAGSSFATLELN